LHDGARRYERLLAVEPRTAPGLSTQQATRRGLEELVLISHRRGLEDARTVSSGIGQARAFSEAGIVSRALEDVSSLENVVRTDTEKIERRLLTLPQATWPVARALKDIRLLRTVARSDLRRLALFFVSVDPRLAELYKTRETADALALAMSEQSKAVLWLREQFKRGALPPDPDFVEALLARATGDPDLVLRLQRETLAAEGSDLYDRLRPLIYDDA
jgi:hypothetical protein